MGFLYLGLAAGFIGGWIICGLFVSHKALRLQVMVEQLRAVIDAYQTGSGPFPEPKIQNRFKGWDGNG
jgi:uncharacterized membrane protein YciS (DUF1049 family)